MLVGPSAHNGTLAFELIHVGMVNDLHFWGVVRIPGGDDPIPIPQDDLWSKVPHLAPRGQQADAFAEEGLQLAMVDNWQHRPVAPCAMGADEVEAEFCLCQRLVEWNPWSLPPPELVDSMGKVSFGLLNY